MARDIPALIIITHRLKKQITKIFCYTFLIFGARAFLMCGQVMTMYNYCNHSTLPIVIKIHWVRERCIAGKLWVLNISPNHKAFLPIASLPVLVDTMQMETAAASVLTWAIAFNLMWALL